MRLKLREPAFAAVMLGLIVFLAYGDVAFLGFTLSPALYMSSVLVPPYGYVGRMLRYPAVLDPVATGSQSWPVYQLMGTMLKSGQLPLWNPYQGTGVPLAADPTWAPYFPFELLHAVLGNTFWDYIWLTQLWFAGVLAFLLFRRLGLGQVASVGGAFAYVLGSGFIFSPFMPWSDVATMTPAVLLAAKHCFDEPLTRKSVLFMSAAVGVSILGGHLESLILQALFLGLFVLFEAVTLKNFRGLLTCLLSTLLGLGLTAFYWLPILEYLSLAAVFHQAVVGTQSMSTGGDPFIGLLALFVPYFYGFLHTYPYPGLSSVYNWDLSPGYVGTVVLFLSLIPLLCHGTHAFRRHRHYLFFILAETLILMKIFGLPPVNWIGYLPVLNFIFFSRYSGSMLALSFGGACGFGLEAVAGHMKHCWRASLVVLIALLFPVALTIPFPVSPTSPVFFGSMAYLALAIYYLALSAAVSRRGGTTAATLLVFLMVLELVSYIPRSLAVGFEELRVAVLAATALFIVANGLGWTKHAAAFLRLATPRGLIPTHSLRIAAIALLLALVAQAAVSASAPAGLPNRYNPYTVAPYVRFLEANVGYQRVYSIDGTFFPTVAGVYSIQNLGEFSSLMPSTFKTFIGYNLDPGAIDTTLVGNAYFRNDSFSPAEQIFTNLAYYSLLGVKYFVTRYSNLSTSYGTTLPQSKRLAEGLPIAYRDRNATIYQNPEVFPRAFITDHAIVAQNQQDAVLKTRELSWSTKNTTVVEGNLPIEFAPLNTITNSGSNEGAAEIEGYSPTEVTIRAKVENPSLLILTDTFYPGWNAYEDNVAVTTYRAYGLVRAVLLQPGFHEIIFKYEPISLQRGVYVTLTALSVAALLLTRRIRLEHSKRDTVSQIPL